jgi:ABC-type uncharacterized transport system substrate-binding protein
MVNVLALHSVGNSIITYLRNTYPQQVAGIAMPACSFDLVSCSQLATTDGPNLPDIYRQAARLVDRILKGTNPADLPFELPTRYELIVNLKAAKAISLTIPDSFLLLADEVIE